MTDEDEDLGEADLHIAGTRPWMVPVMNVSWFVLWGLIGFTGELATWNWHLTIFAIPVWPVTLWIFRKDHNAWRILVAWLKTAALDMCASWFSATSIEVFPTTYRGQYRGIPSA